MKRNCNGCRALNSRFKCELGVKNEPVYFNGIGGPVFSAKPLSECHKPKTYDDYLFLLKTNQKGL